MVEVCTLNVYSEWVYQYYDKKKSCSDYQVVVLVGINYNSTDIVSYSSIIEVYRVITNKASVLIVINCPMTNQFVLFCVIIGVNNTHAASCIAIIICLPLSLII